MEFKRRFVFLVGIGGGASAACVTTQLLFRNHHQNQNISTAVIGLLVIVSLVVWGFRCISKRFGSLLLAGVMALVIAGLALFRFEGFTGNLVPIFSFRFTRILEARVNVGSASESAAALNSYPQFLGPSRDGQLPGVKLSTNWTQNPPRPLWRKAVGSGWSGFAVEGERSITQEQRGPNEAIVCYNTLTGSERWAYAYPAHFESAVAGEGPRATPTIFKGRVYAMGATGWLCCLELESGKVIWAKDIVAENGAVVMDYGMSCSPLCHDGLVIVSVGGHEGHSLVACRADTGEIKWAAGHASAGYSSPILMKLAGSEAVIIFNSGGVFGHAVNSGSILWQYPWPAGHPHVSTPLWLPGDHILISSGYGTGSELVSIQKLEGDTYAARRVWKSNRLKAKFTNLIYYQGFIYGLDDGIMACLDAADGALQWKDGRYGHGQTLLVGTLLLVMAESGEIVLLDASPKAFHEIARFPTLTGKMWNPPALAAPYLLVRNEKEAACYRLPLN